MVNAQALKNNKKKLQAVMLCCRTKKRCAAVGDVNDAQDPFRGEEEAAKFTGGCGYLMPKYNVDATVLYINFPEGTEDEPGADRKRPMQAEEALTIFRRISDKDVQLMGFTQRNHPAQMILTHMAIPPPCVRPTIAMGAVRSEDDVTAKLLDLLKVNKMLKTLVDDGAGDHIVAEFAKLLQYHIYTLSDNCIIGIPQATTKSKRPLKSIRERLKSKEGRLRGNLMGKRVDFCARSVIGGDANLDTEQVGVPRSIALNLTFPERVTPHNLDWLNKLVKNGPGTWPGARYVIRDDGSRQDLRYVGDTSKIALQYGWKVERHMLDGDYIIFNRQPSLHKMSMMGHRTKIMPFSTLRFNLAVTSPYNADFDGDEMNLHLAQSHETRAEIKHMMLNPCLLVSAQGNKPVMGMVQDSLLAVSKFTKRDTMLERDLVMNLLMWVPGWDGQLPIPFLLKPKPMWTGKQILSLLLPRGLNLKRDAAIAGKNKKDNPDFAQSDCKVLIQDGQILSGIVCKKTVGTGGGGLLHLVWLDYGPEKCRNVLSYLQKIGNQWLTHNGLTCGVADIIANDETLREVDRTLSEAKKEVRKILAEAQRGRLEAQPGKTMYQTFEAKVNQRLNAAREDAGRIGGDSLDERNNIISMVNAGSKGSPINVAQIIACVGQQNVEGARIRYGFDSRTLPHFTKDDYGAESRGFVENSYLAGLTPQEVWMHAMGGREGVIDTACKTSETGYIQRRLVKSMETLRTHYDGTSRNGNNEIIQFLYGEDGMDGVWIEDQGLDIMGHDNKSFDKSFKHDYHSEEYGVNWLDNSVLSDIKINEESQSILDKEYKKLRELRDVLCKEVYPDGDSKQHIPINCARLMGRAKLRAKQEDSEDLRTKYTPMEIIKLVDELMGRLEITRAIAEGDTIGREVEDNAKIVLNAHLRTHLNSKKILMTDGLSKESLNWVMGEIEQRFNKSNAVSGEMIGTLAAQSVGEPATQMTLNTFHFAGVGAKNVTLGVPRLKELINVAKTVKTPSLAVYLNGDLGKDQERAKDVQSILEHTTLGKVTSFTQIFWDPDPVNTRIEEDKEWVAEYYELPDEDEDPSRCGPWLLRIQLSNKVMTDKKLTVREVGERIIADFLSDLDVIFTDDNAEELVLRIRLLKELEEMEQGAPAAFNPNDDKEDKDFKFLRGIEDSILKEMTLQGILGIKKVFMREDTISSYDKEKGGFSRNKEWVLDTDGVNMEEVMQIPEVDFSRCQSNDIVEILNILGIEATRKALLFHVRMVISFDGSYVNYRHLGTLCDVMTQRGHLMAITRHGVNRTNMGPLMKCSFEETVEILMDAAIYAETDYMRAVSENCIMGQQCPIGTAVFDLYMSDEKGEDGDPCDLDFATPVLPHMKGKETFSTFPGAASPTNDSPLPVLTPYASPGAVDVQAADSRGSMSDLQTPFITPMQGEEGEEGLMAGQSPFSPMGAGTPFSQPSPGARTSPMASAYSPGTPAETSQFRSPSYTPASASPDGIDSPAMSEFSQSYPYSASPAYTPDGSAFQSSRFGETTSSPSYAAAAYSPTFSPSHTPFGAHYGSPGTSMYSPAATSPHDPVGGALDPTSPADTPVAYSPGSPEADEFMSPALMSPGEARAPVSSGSPIVQEFYEAPASPTDRVAPTSPSYTPHMPPAATAARQQPRFAEPALDETELMGAGDSDDDAMSTIFEPADEI
jgi:DNA-directed RNA polymerase II subunit RPB1